MTKPLTILAVFLAASALGGAAFAQSATPIANRDVVGDWALVITPAERRGLEINVDFDEDDLPLTITAPRADRLACVLRSRPAECRLEGGRLVVVMPTASGGARMIFTLTDRTLGGFSGAAVVRMRLLPFGGHIGSVAMTRR